MKDILASLIRESDSPLEAQNVMREYLQARILACLQCEGAMIPLAFHGGTALRFLYGLPRHSEHLDFTLEDNSASYDMRRCIGVIEAKFYREGYELETILSK